MGKKNLILKLKFFLCYIVNVERVLILLIELISDGRFYMIECEGWGY